LDDRFERVWLNAETSFEVFRGEPLSYRRVHHQDGYQLQFPDVSSFLAFAATSAT